MDINTSPTGQVFMHIYDGYFVMKVDRIATLAIGL